MPSTEPGTDEETAVEPRGPTSVLFVDDDPGVAETAVASLEQDDDVAVVTAGTAEAALESLGQDPVDCVVADYDLPGMDGLALLSAVREDHPDLPFVLFTGKGSEAVAGEALSAGATDYVRKGHDRDQYAVLANRIRTAVDHHRATRRAATRRRLRSLASDVTQALVRADDRETAERRVCELLGGSDLYDVAWIGSQLADAEVVPRVTAGDGADAPGRADAADPADLPAVPGRSQAAVALEDDGLVVSRDGHAPPEDRDGSAAGGVAPRAMAAVPLRYEDGDLGVLVVGTDRAGAFTEAERDLLADVGSDVAHAIKSIELREELRAERTFTDQALDALDDLFYVVGPDAELRRWNDRVGEVTGYDDATIAEMHALEFFPADHREAIEQALDGMLAEATDTVEADVLTADGRRIPHEFTGTQLAGPDGEPVGFVGIGRDVTRRRERERALRREQERFGALFESVPEPVVHVKFHDGDPVVQNVNAAFETVFGYEAATIRGESLDEYVVPPGRADEAATVNERAAAGEELTREVSRLTADGSERTFLFRVVQTDTGQGPTEAVGMYVDITDQKRRERQLERYEALLEVVNDGVYVLDPQGRYTYVNSYAAEKTGYDREELVGATATKILPEAAVERFEDAIPSLVAGDRETYAEEVEVQPRDDEPYLADVKITTLVEDGEHERTVGVVRDVTERKERERRLERQNERLDRFASVVSHDLQNPLNVAQGYLEEVREDVDREELGAVADALARMEALVDNLLTLARSGETVDDRQTVDLAALVEGCWGNVATAGGTLVIDVERDVRADPRRLKQLLENVFGNAVEHGGDDVTVTVGSIPGGFYVADDGPGIPPGEREAVLESGYTTETDGTGFGLAIVAEVAAGHGWDVSITESEDGGARLEFRGVEHPA